jgi:hypothetical protein
MNKKWIGLSAFVLLLMVGIYQIVMNQGSQEYEELVSLKQLNMPNLNSDSIASKSALERDPFDPILLNKKVIKRKVTRPKVRKEVIKKAPVVPSFRVSSILGGKTPLAVLKRGGQTKFVRAGDEAWGWSVENITSLGVELTQDDNEYLLKP